MTLKEKLPNIQKNIPLAKYTTLKVGGPAKYFFVAKNKEDLVKGVKAAKRFKLSLFILGGGSNILIGNKGFKGLVIKNEARNFEIKNNRIIAESGVILNKIIETVIKAGLMGLEKGSGIPGTLGGAVYGNAGWSKEAWAIGDVVENVELLWPDGKTEKVGKKWLSFGYRDSRLEKIKSKKPVILEVVLKLRSNFCVAGKLKKGNRRDLEKRRREILRIRSEKIPPGFSAGSIFKNPPGESAGYLIEKCGLKGKRIGDAEISKKHANFIINSGGAKADDVIKLMKLAKQKVKNKFGVLLKEEIKVINS